jgi:cysteine protease IpaJ
MQKQQFYGNSCGAACLLCAAGELGIANLPSIPGSMCLGQPLQADNGCESALYQITSGATTGQQPIGTNLANAGYSFPHNIVFAARLLGLDGEVYMESGFFSTALSWLYPRCELLCAQSNIPIRRYAPPPLTPNERLLRVVGVLKVVGLHYVMRRPRGTYMDPADGQDFPTFPAMNNSWSKSYADTGISIVLRRQIIPGNTVVGRQAQRDRARHLAGTAWEAPF